MSLRGFFRLLLSRRLPNPASGVDDSLARTAKDALHMRGAASQKGGFSGTSAVYEHIEKGYENYAKSFDEEEEPRKQPR